MTELWCTRAALRDLDLDEGVHARLPATEYADAHPVVRAFVERRGCNPRGGETTQLPVTRVTVYNLHSERYRGLTWHDEEAGIVWLLGVGYHRAGDRDDAYEVLKRRDEQGTLLPTQQDYLDLEADRASIESFLRALREAAKPLLDEARVRERGWATERIGDVMDVSVGIERLDAEALQLEDVYVILHMPPKAGVLPPYPEWLAAVLACLLPDARPEQLDYAAELPFPLPQGQASDFHLVCWRNDRPA